MAGMAISLAVVSLSALLALYPGTAAASQTSTDNLGVLFYSPTERMTIVRGRSENTADEIPSSSLQLDGLVRRGQGKSTVWINSRPIPEERSITQKHAVAVTPAGVAVDGKPLRIGESVDLTTGQRSDLVPPGGFSVKKPK